MSIPTVLIIGISIEITILTILLFAIPLAIDISGIEISNELKHEYKFIFFAIQMSYLTTVLIYYLVDSLG